MSAPEARVVPCPHCHKPARFAADNPWRPFCSERCRAIDLGAWATDSYRVAAEPPEGDDEASPPAEPRPH